MIGIGILAAFGLLYYVPIDILWRKIQHTIPERRHNCAQIGIRIGSILLIGAFAMAVPKLDAFIGLVGAIFSSILVMFVPTVLQAVFMWPETGRFHWALIKNGLLAVAAWLALVAGSWVSLEDIVAIYRE